MREFKVGDLVYCPYYGTDVFEVQPNEWDEDSDKYPLMIGDKTFTVHGKDFDHRPLREIFHATPENHELLEKLYGIEFEKPPAPPTSKEIILAMLARGDKYVCCWVSDSATNPTIHNAPRFIRHVESVSGIFIDNILNHWLYATPFDPRTNEPITELPE